MKTGTENFTRYKPGQIKGHYESFFQRANHPSLPQAFWIRYTLFSPASHPENAIGEIWAIYFDQITGVHVTVKKEIQFEKCVFKNDRFFVSIDDSTLNGNALSGSASSANNTISWDLNYSCDSKPLFVLPENLYDGGFPKAKLLVGSPLAAYNGKIMVNNKPVEIINWIGSQNHNWGIKHTDNYAWGQVAGFDNSPGSFFEISTARLKYGPLWTPYLTLMVLRHNNREYRLNSIWQALKAKGKFSSSDWTFSSETKDIKLEGRIMAATNDFVELSYYNPPGGIKKCMNTKIAGCNLKLTQTEKTGNIKEVILETAHRAAFEILS